MKMLTFNNLTNPLPENILIEFVSEFKFISFGFLFEFPSLMIDIFHSLQPAPVIVKYVQFIRKRLMEKLSINNATTTTITTTNYLYIVGHLRVENDYHGWMNEVDRKLMHREAVKYLIHNNTCLSHWPKDPQNPNKLIDPPPLYLASGLWGQSVDLQEILNSFVNGTIVMDEQRLDQTSLSTFTLYLLYEAGFRQVFTKEMIIKEIEQEQQEYWDEKDRRKREKVLYEAELLANGGNSSAVLNPPKVVDMITEAKFQADSIRFQEYFDFVPFHKLLPEQLAMVDLFVSRHAPCFCPAHIESSFSYWVLRMRDFANHKNLQFSEVTPALYGEHAVFAGWGV
jgi:hypothetical protein